MTGSAFTIAYFIQARPMRDQEKAPTLFKDALRSIVES